MTGITSIIIAIISAIGTFVAAYYYIKYTLKHHSEDIGKLKTSDKDNTKAIQDMQVILERHNIQIEQFSCAQKEMTDKLSDKLDRVVDKMQELSEKVAFMYGSLSSFDEIKVSLEKIAKSHHN